MRHARRIVLAITFTLVGAATAYAESASDFSAACGCDRDCQVYGSAYRCNGSVCTVGGSGTPCTDAEVPDTWPNGEPGADWDAQPPDHGIDDALPGPDLTFDFHDIDEAGFYHDDAGTSRDSGSNNNTNKDSGGCNVAPTSEPPAAGTMLLALLLGAGLALLRRRRGLRRR